jgi:thiamine biosynthesis lipoprotein ApbE
MSHYDPQSELSRFNRAPAHMPFKVSPEFARVLRFSLELNRRSRGAFDPTMAPVINLWGFGEKTDQRAVPPAAELQAAMEKTGCQHLEVTERDELIKRIPGLAINLSAVAKGFGVDEMVRVSARRGLTNVYASIAGEVMVTGHNERATKWQLGIAAPVDHWNEDSPMATAFSLSDQAADAPGTTLFVLGVEAGMKFIEAYTNAAALFIVREAEGSYRQIRSSRFPGTSHGEADCTGSACYDKGPFQALLPNTAAAATTALPTFAFAALALATVIFAGGWSIPEVINPTQWVVENKFIEINSTFFPDGVSVQPPLQTGRIPTGCCRRSRTG